MEGLKQVYNWQDATLPMLAFSIVASQRLQEIHIKFYPGVYEGTIIKDTTLVFLQLWEMLVHPLHVKMYVLQTGQNSTVSYYL